MRGHLKKITTDAAPAAIGPYSQAIVVAGGHSLVFVSGQLPIDPRTGEFIQGDIRALTRQTLDNIEAILQASSSSLYQVIKTEVFLKDLARDFNGMNEEYAKRFNPLVPPARQTIQVADLPKGSPIEISCIAIVYPSDASR
jgi:2-iminobutanoate/2-iminopropanoate deaminase